MTEEWRDIAGYEGLYKVSNRGEVMRMAQDIIGKYGDVYHKPEHLLKPSQGGKDAHKGNGYLQVHLFKNGNMKTQKNTQTSCRGFYTKSLSVAAGESY